MSNVVIHPVVTARLAALASRSKLDHATALKRHHTGFFAMGVAHVVTLQRKIRLDPTMRDLEALERLNEFIAYHAREMTLLAHFIMENHQ